jgi:hypothetical protein
MFSFDKGLRAQGGGKYQNPLCGRLFFKSQLSELMTDSNFPKEASLHIEAQVWIIPSLDFVKTIHDR